MSVVFSSSCIVFLFTIFFLVSIYAIPREKRQSGACDSNGFQCDSGDCIQKIQLCDGAKDCPDGSDETKAVCSRLSIVCPSYSFRCAYGACIDWPLACDGKRDCADGSDELRPECKTNTTAPSSVIPSSCKVTQFRCDSGQCIDGTSVCDGLPDCRDGSDETISQCVNFPCPEYSFQCSYGACVDRDTKCNGKKDCNDGSDEEEEVCLSLQGTPQRPLHKPSEQKPSGLNPQTSQGKCILPEQPRRGQYTVGSCKDCGLKHGDLVSTPFTIIYTCPANQTFKDSSSAGPVRIHCLTDGETLSTSWTESPHPLDCYYTCKPILGSNIVASCIFEGKLIPCSERVPHNTVAHLSCPNNYRAPASVQPTATCQDGSWQNLFRCTPECGITTNPNVVPTIAGGTATSALEFPWQAALYIRDAENGGQKLICGGSIISPFVVLTAAHCLYEARRKRNATEIKVALGKTSGSWEVTDEGQQLFTVRKLEVASGYSGVDGNYVQDIAFIDLYKIIEISASVMPVCLETVEPYAILTENTVGYVVGWGYTETGKQAKILQKAELSYLDREKCKKRVPDFINHITYDKFCGIFTKGSKIRQGDSGGGWTYVKGNPYGPQLHYIRGIVSVKSKVEGQDFFAAFTDVQQHMNLIQSTIKVIEKEHEKDPIA